MEPMESEIVIRDFAYKPDDPRYSGIYPQIAAQKKVEHDIEVEDEESDDSEEDWEWFWSYRVKKAPRKELVILDLSDVNILPAFQKELSNDLKETRLYRAKTIFPFVKGTEYEMSLETSDELIIVQKLVLEDTLEKLSTDERWSSIDELASPSKPVELTFEPPLEEFSKQILHFFDFNKNYGDGWLLGLKVKVYGCSGKAKIVLKDLGLVPGNYVESTQ